MTKNFSKGCRRLAVAAPIVLAVVAVGQNAQIGREVAIPSHLADGEEFNISLPQLIQFGQQLFNAKFTVQEGAGRPRSKGRLTTTSVRTRHRRRHHRPSRS